MIKGVIPLRDMVLPKVECDLGSGNYGRFIISPLESGYGITMGNALRRVLLSSLPGAAVTSIKIEGVYHEFSPIPHVREDTTALILNIKQLRFKSHSDGPVRLGLVAKGEGVVTAGDIECPSDVEIINPDLHLLTLDSDEAEVEMELVVERGRGYSPAEERGKLPIGEIPVDAIFSPIRKLGYTVEQGRSGQIGNFDRLIMEIWTNGTIQPGEALTAGAQILAKHFGLVAGFGEVPVEEVEEGIPPKVYEMPIDELELSPRVYNCLRRADIRKVGEVLDRLAKGDEEMLAIRNFGKKSLQELKEALQAKGLIPAESPERGEGGV